MTYIFWTARAAVILYVVSLFAQITSRRRIGKWAWIFGCLVLWAHFVLAMQFVYGWDFALLSRETTRQSAMVTGFALGFEVYFSFAMMVIWALDAAYWLLRCDARYRNRPAWISVGVSFFIAFIMFNSVVVFAQTSWVRFAGLAACIALIALALAYYRRMARCRNAVSEGIS